MKFSLVFLATSISAALGAPQTGGNFFAQLAPGPYEAALATLNNDLTFTSGDGKTECGNVDTACLCKSQEFLTKWYKAMYDSAYKCSEADLENAEKTWRGACGSIYKTPISDESCEKAKSAAKAQDGESSSNSTDSDLPTLSTSDNSTTTTGGEDTSGVPSAPAEAEGAGIRTVGSMSIMTAALLGVVFMTL